MNEKDKNKEKEKIENIQEPDTLGKIGAVLNIVFAVLSIPLWFFMILTIVLIPIGIVGIIGSIFTVKWNNEFYKGNQNSKTAAGVTGLLFTFLLIGGIFVLVSSPKNK